MGYNKKKPILCHKKQSELIIPSEVFLSITQDILKKGLTFRFRVTGFSMLPFIKDGDIITVIPIQNSHISVGDVVVIANHSFKKIIVHRVVKKIETSYLIKGDNCFEFDGVVSCNNILGKVVKVERGNKNMRLGIGQEKRVLSLLSRNRLCISISFLFRKTFILIKNNLFNKPSP